MMLTVLGGCGAWPEAGGACSGYVVEYEGFRLLLDLGYATVPRLLEHCGADEVDAVFITHGHPDHCADLNPLLRARAMRDEPAPALPVYAPTGALDAVLALDRPAMLASAYDLHELVPGARFEIGPFVTETRLLPHALPNAGVRLAAGGRALMYTGDTGPSTAIHELALDADLMLAEATHLGETPEAVRAYLSSADLAGRNAREAQVGRLVLTHLWPGTDHARAKEEAARSYPGPIDVAVPSLTIDLGAAPAVPTPKSAAAAGDPQPFRGARTL